MVAQINVSDPPPPPEEQSHTPPGTTAPITDSTPVAAGTPTTNSQALETSTLISTSPGDLFPSSHYTDISSIAIAGSSTPTGPSSKLTSVTSTSSSSIPTATSGEVSKVASSGGLSYGAKLAAIIVPTLFVLALIPIIYICYIHRRYKKRRESVLPEVRQQPREAALLHAHHPSHDSVSSATAPFTDSERAKEPSVIEATWEHHIEDTSRAPSPVLPSPSRPAFHAQEQWPLSGPLPEPPPPPPKHIEPAEDDDELIRPPSSNYGSRQAMLPRPPSEHEEVVSPQDQGYDHEAAMKHRQSDAVSELSYDSRSRRHRTKSMDGESFISAMDEEPVHDPMPTRRVL